MFEARKATTPPASAADDVITPAAAGYSLFVFAPKERKASLSTLQEMIRSEAHPVLAWRWPRGSNVPEPLTYVATPAGPRYLLLPTGRYIALDDPEHPSWASFDQFASAHLLPKWRVMMHQPAIEPPAEPGMRYAIDTTSPALIPLGGFR